MTDLSLRERLASYNIHDPVAGTVEQAILEWLSDNGLAIVPVKLTNAMWTALFNQSTVDREWADVLKAAPPAACNHGE